MTRLIILMIISIFSSANGMSKENDLKNNISIPKNCLIDSIVVLKSERKMIVFSNWKMIKEYKIALGHQPIGKKHFEGDGKTPEGLYYIDAKSAISKFHKNLNVSYPNNADIEFADATQKTVGGDIKIHGLPNGLDDENYTVSDWTLGCIGLTNAEIDELFSHIKLDSPILILP